MKKPWSESNNSIPILVLITVILLIIFGIQKDIISLNYFVRNRDFIDALSIIITTLAIIIGGILSYIKFFKGRVLKPKLNLKPSCGFVESNKDNLHWLTVELENMGTVSIWYPQIEASVIFHLPNGKLESKPNLNFTSLFQGNEGEQLIDVGESLNKHATLTVPKDVLALTFKIMVNDSKGTIWESYITTPNVKAEKQ